ncbi:MAG: ROK family protein, partial [bacterium]|nr:ROK family protein [bacterium]
IGVDAGGTHLRVALLNETGKIVAKETSIVGPERSPEKFFTQLAQVIQKTAGDRLKKIDGIGLGLPGICNPKEGVIHQLPHYPEWKDVPVGKILKKSFKVPVYFDNDANMAALGEHWKGVARKYPTFIMLTLGTGIGGGLILENKLWRGEEGFAGEVGHMVIERNGRPCACGGQGCWERYASAGAVPKGQTALSLSKLAEAGDGAAKDFWREFGEYLGMGIGNLANITGVEHFVLAGGVSKAWPHFIDAAKKKIAKGTYPRLSKKIVLTESSLKGDAALLGCAFAVFKGFGG